MLSLSMTKIKSDLERVSATYKAEYRAGFRNKGFVYQVRWGKVRKSKDNKKI